MMSKFTILAIRRKNVIENLVMEMCCWWLFFLLFDLNISNVKKKTTETQWNNWSVYRTLHRNKNHFEFSWDLVSICKLFSAFRSALTRRTRSISIRKTLIYRYWAACDNVDMIHWTVVIDIGMNSTKMYTRTHTRTRTTKKEEYLRQSEKSIFMVFVDTAKIA